MANDYNDLTLTEDLKDLSLNNEPRNAVITGDISYERKLQRVKYLQLNARDADKLTKENVIATVKENFIEYEDSRSQRLYLVNESNTLRFLFSNAHMITSRIREPIFGYRQPHNIYIKATDDHFSSDMILSINNERVLQLATFVLEESSAQVKILDSVVLPKLGCASKFTIVGNEVKGSQFICLSQSLNTLSVLFFDIYASYQETTKLIKHDRQLLLPKSKLLYGSMTSGHQNLKSCLIAIWNCQRVHLIYLEWKDISDGKHAFRLVLPNVSVVTRIVYLNCSLFIIASEQEQNPILITTSQVKTGDREFKTVSKLFNFVNMEAECNVLINKLQSVYPQQLSSFNECVLVLVNNRDILAVLSGKGEDVVYFHLLRTKFAVRFYVIDIDDKGICIDMVSKKGIQKHRLPLKFGKLYRISEDFMASEKTGKSAFETVYKSYSKVSHFITCNSEETKGTLWCSGDSGIYQIDKDGYQIQLVEELEGASHIGFVQQQFVFKYSRRHLEENRTFVIVYLGEKVVTKIVSMSENGNMIGSKDVTSDLCFNVVNEHTINIFSLSGSLFQVLAGCILEIKSNGERTVCYEDKPRTGMRIISAIGIGETSEIAMLLNVGDDNSILFSIQEISCGKLVEKWEQWMGHGTVKPIRYNACTGTIHFEIASDNTIASYTYYVFNKDLQAETWNLQGDCVLDYAQAVINYGLNGNGESLYVQTVKHVGHLKRYGKEERALFFSDEVCQLVQIADNCVLIHDTTHVGLLMNGTIVRVPGIEGNRMSSILEATAIVENGALILLCVVFDTHTIVVHGTHVSNIVRSHDVKAKHNRTYMQSFCYFESLKRMVVCNLQKQMVYALKLGTGKTASLEYATLRDLRHIYHFSEVEPSHAAILGVTRNGAQVAKLCKISFKRGKLRMRDVGELVMGRKLCSEEVTVRKRWASAPELWIARDNQVTVVKFQPEAQPGAQPEVLLKLELNLGLDMVLSPTLLCIKSNTYFYIGRINEVLTYKESALWRCEGSQSLDVVSSQARLYEDGSLVIWGNDKSTGEGRVLVMLTGGLALSVAAERPIPAVILTVPPDPVDVTPAGRHWCPALTSLGRTDDLEKRYKVLHVTGCLTTITLHG